MAPPNPSSLGIGAGACNALPVLGLGVGPPLAPSNLEAMEVHEDPVMELDANPAAKPDPPADWRTPYLDYLLRDTLPTDKIEARWLTHHAKSFFLVEGELYKQSHIGILQLCIPSE